MSTQQTLVIRMIAAFVVGGLLGVAMLFTEPYVVRTAEFPNEKNVEPALSSNVVYYEDSRGYLAQPMGGEKRPAVILLHERWGLDEDMRSLARQFADEGYIALAVDLYKGETTADPQRARELTEEAENDRERVMDNLRGAVQFLRSKENVDPERIASVGWGVGGTWSYRTAQSDLGTRASVMYYGEIGSPDDVLSLRTPLLGHFGELDASVDLDSVHEIMAKLATSSTAHELYLYPSAHNGFADKREGTNLQYNEEASLLAWSRTLEFLMHALEEN